MRRSWERCRRGAYTIEATSFDGGIGTYTIEARAFQTGQTGTYNLGLTTTGAAHTLGRPVRPPAPRHKDPLSLKQRHASK